MSLVLFDFNGLLADTLVDMLSFAQEVCDELGVKHTVVQTDLSVLEVMSFAMIGRVCINMAPIESQCELNSLNLHSRRQEILVCDSQI